MKAQEAVRYRTNSAALCSKVLLERGFPVSCMRSSGTIDAAANSVLLVMGEFDSHPQTANSRCAFSGWKDQTRRRPPITQIRSADELGLERPGTWKPWFPVIDYSRCTNCMQCLSFCLFDVYGVSPDGKIQVQHQSNCKTDCPACSRVCPEVAIMFPKYRHGPINGEEVKRRRRPPRSHEGGHLRAAWAATSIRCCATAA